MTTPNRILYIAVGFLWALMFLTAYVLVIAQEIDPVFEDPTPIEVIPEIYSDGKETDSIIEAILKTATATDPVILKNYVDDRILEKLESIDKKLNKLLLK